MKEYALALSRELSTDDDIETATENINADAANGWVLVFVTPQKNGKLLLVLERDCMVVPPITHFDESELSKYK